MGGAQRSTFFTRLSLSGAWSKSVSKASRSAMTCKREHGVEVLEGTPLPSSQPAAISSENSHPDPLGCSALGFQPA